MHEGNRTLPRPVRRVFVTGATGVLGRAVVPLLKEQGVDVVVHAHSSHGGVPPAAVDVALTDVSGLRQHLGDVDAILHLASSIPTGRSATERSAWRTNDLLRSRATAALVDAASNSGPTVFVYPSVSFVYADGADRWLRAGAPVDPGPALLSTLVAEEHVARFSADSSRRGVVLRLGGLYGPSSIQTLTALKSARAGRLPITGAPGSFAPTLWVADAASALVTALLAPSGVYDVVDDEPLTREDIAQVYSDAVGVALPTADRKTDERLKGSVINFMLRSQRITNTAFRQSTRWRPAVPSVRHALDQLVLMVEQA